MTEASLIHWGIRPRQHDHSENLFPTIERTIFMQVRHAGIVGSVFDRIDYLCRCTYDGVVQRGVASEEPEVNAPASRRLIEPIERG